MKKHIFEGKLTQLLESEQFERPDNMNDSIVQKNDKKIDQRTIDHEQKEWDHKQLICEVEVNW